MAMPKFVRGIGGKFMGGIAPTAISILYEKVKDNLGDYVNEYLENRKKKGAQHLMEMESRGIDDAVRGYAANIAEEGKQKLSYLDDRINYVLDAVRDGRENYPSVAHAARTAQDLFTQLFNYPAKKYLDLAHKVIYDGDAPRHYISSSAQTVKGLIEWFESLDDWKKNLVYGLGRRAEKYGLVKLQEKTGLPLDKSHLDRIVGAAMPLVGKLKDFVSELADYSAVIKGNGYVNDRNPYGRLAYAG